MTIEFSWNLDTHGYRPVSKSDALNRDGLSLLDCVLMDDGGLSSSVTLRWLEEGIRRVNSVLTGEIESSDWSRETWGVAFKNNKARIYSLHDEDYFQIIGLNGFSRALQEWTRFLRSKPDGLKAEALIISIDG